MLGPDRPRFNVTPPVSKAPPLEAHETTSAHHALAIQKAAAVRKFVAAVGGLENARRALEMLAILNKAA